MLRHNHSLLLPLSLLALGGCTSAPPRIELARVERVLTTLAADSMEGRRSFTEGAEKAAKFLEAEFDAIGLEPFSDLTGYRQEFPVYDVTAESSRVMLNGEEVSSENVALLLFGSFQVDTDDTVDIVMVGESDDPRSAFAALFGATENTLVLIHPAHRELFDRVRQFTARPRQSIDPTSSANTAIVLTSTQQVESFEIEASASSTEAGRIANIIGTIPGRRSDELVLFSAHYDHIGIVRPVEGDSTANGANDDASGVTAVVELARYFKALSRPERTLVFAAFIAEEMGGYGSRYLSTQLEADQIVAMFNIEMIGKVAAEGPRRAWITGWDKSDFGPILEQADTTFTFYGDPHPEFELFNRSDNAVFARLGVPAHSISTTSMDGDPDYHRVTDEVETLDLEHMTVTIRGVADGAMPIISRAATPSRVDPGQLR